MPYLTCRLNSRSFYQNSKYQAARILIRNLRSLQTLDLRQVAADNQANILSIKISGLGDLGNASVAVSVSDGLIEGLVTVRYSLCDGIGDCRGCTLQTAVL